MTTTQAISNLLAIEDGALVWRLCGERPDSSQHGKVGRAAHWGQHTRARKDERIRWQGILLAAKNRHAVSDAWQCPKPAQLVIRMWGPSPPDTPNMGGHAKYPVDALVALGFLVKDSPRFVPRTITEVPHPRPTWAPPGRGMEIRIEAM